MKNINSKFLLIIFIEVLFSIVNIANAQCVTGEEYNSVNPKRDMRGVFIPSVLSISWPTNRNATPVVQQAELISILDDIKTNNYNVVFLQVRPECDALYKSTIEPWSYWITGAQGTAPSPLWDPLVFAITEAHNRGLELHAWLNPYRAKRGTDTSSATHVTNAHPEWVFTASNNANLKVLDPGLPAVQDYVVDVVEDIAIRYDVDGIHFDDYFYPKNGMLSGTNTQDYQTYLDNKPTDISNIEDFRRYSVNQMIGKVYDALQSINTNNNKNIVFGVSPFGIWKSGVPSGISGSSSYFDLYCDPISWLEAGKVDYLAPQLYWKITGAQDYISLSQWWNDQAALYNKQVYVSQSYYKMDSSVSSWNWSSSEIQNQINQNRSTSMNATFGQISYRYNEIDNNLKGINTTLSGNEFKYKSFPAPIEGNDKDNICPLKPENVRFGTLKIMWDIPTTASDGDTPIKYVVYEFDDASQALSNMNDGSRILDIVVENELTLTQSQIDTKFFVVTSLDKNNNEAGDFTEEILSIANYNSNNFVIFPTPCNNEINISLPQSYSDSYVYIQLLDTIGRIVYNKKHLTNGQNVNLKELHKYSDGNYFMFLLDINLNIIHKEQIIKISN